MPGFLSVRSQEILEQILQAANPAAHWAAPRGGGAFKVWEVAILTTVGSSLAARSAKESGAGRAAA